MPTQRSDEDGVGMRLHVLELRRRWKLGRLAKVLLLFCYGLLDIGRK